jgi:hypothetical protein
VAHRGDDRHRHPRDRARHRFLVERPEIFERAAAAADDDHVDTRHARDLAKASRNLRSGILALDPRRADDEVQVRIATPQHFDDVADRGAVERGDDPDLARQCWQRPLSGGVEQPFLLQAFLELIERELPRAETVRLEVLADELVFAFRFVHRELAARDHAQTVGGLELQIAQRRPEHEPAQLRRGVFEREVQMPGVPDLAVRQLALDPDLDEPLFEQIAHADGQLGDGEDVTRNRGWGLGAGRLRRWRLLLKR